MNEYDTCIYSILYECNYLLFLTTVSSSLIQETPCRGRPFPSTAVTRPGLKSSFFAGIDKADVQNGGLEVTICDHHTIFADTLMSGVRLCVPQQSPPNDRAVSFALS